MNKVMRSVIIAGLAATALGGVFYPDGATTLHFAFEGSPNGDRPIIRPPAFYRADDGFGFVDSPTMVGTSRGVTAPSYFRFDVNLPPGNYDVTVTPGGTQAESVATLKAEAHRAMLLDVRAAAGRGAQASRATFTVNVRRGTAPDEASMNLDGCLNLEFAGTNPSMMKLDIVPNTTAATVYIAGDESAADRQKEPNAGWGQMLPLLFKAGEIAVSNHATPGCTAQSFIAQHRLEAIASGLKQGDYLVVQFAGDDQEWLKPYCEQARAHQATPVLIVGPLQFNVRQMAREQNIAIIDLPSQIGANLSSFQAFELAKMIAREMQVHKMELATHLIDNLAANSDPAQFPASLGYVNQRNVN